MFGDRPVLVNDVTDDAPILTNGPDGDVEPKINSQNYQSNALLILVLMRSEKQVKNKKIVRIKVSKTAQ